MHILVVNDDGPPSSHASPYVHSLVRALQQAGHRVSVCLPHTQRSWIGKAHIIGQTVEPTYYRPPADQLGGLEADGTYHDRPWGSSTPADDAHPEEWILVNGTPASCVQIGLHHVFQQRGPIDLVVSGPNYGRNTTSVFALSSGTLGGALEAAACGVKAVAVSYAFFRKAGQKTKGVEHEPAVIQEASQHTVRIIEALVRQWPAATHRDSPVDLYSVNVPLLAGMSTRKTVWAPILQNYWRGGACFVEVQEGEAAGGVTGDRAAESEAAEEQLREGEKAGDAAAAANKTAAATTITTSLTHKHYKWQPRFDDVFRSVDEAPPGNDGWAIREGFTSISPLKANFFQAATELHGQEFQL